MPSTQSLKIVGRDFFCAMARDFVVARPPRSPVLATYGDELADFISTFEPARELPYLADVARIEAARTHAYHAADATPVGASQLEALGADALVGAARRSAPFAGDCPLRISRCHYFGYEFGRTGSCADRELERGGCAYRSAATEVEVRLLPPGGAVFLRGSAKADRWMRQPILRSPSAPISILPSI